MIDMEARAAAVRARREAAELIADNGTACATVEQRDYMNARDAAKRTGCRDADTTAQLTMLKAAAVAAHGRA